MQAKLSHQIIEALNLKPNCWRTTSRLLIDAGLNTKVRHAVLLVLHEMEQKGLVAKKGEGTYSWMIPTTMTVHPSLVKDRKMKRSYLRATETPNPAPTTTCSKCGGSGQWVNPNNPSDVRPCFYCRTDEAREFNRQNRSTDRSERLNPQPAPAPGPDNSALLQQIESLTKQLELATKQLELAKVSASTALTIRVKDEEQKTKTEALIKEQSLPPYFNDLLLLAEARENIMLVGPAGCGKTYTAALAAEALGLNFYSISLTQGTPESHLLGRSIPNLTTGEEVYVEADFVRAFTKGGVFLLDEMDAGNDNCLLAINTALANNEMSLSARTTETRVKRHEDFICIASANTFGKGADRQYVGRSQLDEATLDRFRIGTIEVDYSEQIESELCPDQSLLNLLWAIRKHVQVRQLRRVVSTRFIKSAYNMKSRGWDHKRIVKALTSGWKADELVGLPAA